MTDQTAETEIKDGTETPPRGMPRWVKISFVVVAALVAVFVSLNLLGVAPGDHGLMRHVPGRDAPASSAPDHGPRMHDR